MKASQAALALLPLSLAAAALAYREATRAAPDEPRPGSGATPFVPPAASAPAPGGAWESRREGSRARIASADPSVGDTPPCSAAGSLVFGTGILERVSIRADLAPSGGLPLAFASTGTALVRATAIPPVLAAVIDGRLSQAGRPAEDVRLSLVFVELPGRTLLAHAVAETRADWAGAPERASLFGARPGALLAVELALRPAR